MMPRALACRSTQPTVHKFGIDVLVGWVEQSADPPGSFRHKLVGHRCTRPTLHFAGTLAFALDAVVNLGPKR